MKTTKEKIEVMQAFEDGKRVRFRARGTRNDWVYICNPAWNWLIYDYEVVPEPRARWVVTGEGDVLVYYSSQEDAVRGAETFRPDAECHEPYTVHHVKKVFRKRNPT